MIEPSVIVREGISVLIEDVRQNIGLSYSGSIEEAFLTDQPESFKLVLVNPVSLNNSKKNFKKLLNLFGKQKLVGIISNHYDRNLYENFSDNIFINDDRETIEKILLKHTNSVPSDSEVTDNALSTREIDVLKLLANGKSNKEIAEELFISVHTVVSHRKNISAKLGVKSTAALVIYAVANGLINVDDYSE